MDDGLGSARQLVDSAGAVTYAQTFDFYGNMYASAGTNQSVYGFLSAYNLKQSPLLYLNGRWYDPRTGRFITPQSGLPNPYVPLGGLTLLGMGLVLNSKLRRKKWGHVVLMILLIGGVMGTLAGCGGTPPPGTNPPLPPTGTNPPTTQPPTATSTSAPGKVPIPRVDSSDKPIIDPITRD